jgi:hypothetical protein
MLKNPAKYERDISSAKFTATSRQDSPHSLLSVSADNCQGALVDESGMVRSQMGTHNRSENCRSAWDVLYDTTH